MINLSENQKRILKVLNDFGKKPTSQISAIIGRNYETTLKELEKLLKEKKVIKEEENRGDYWSLK